MQDLRQIQLAAYYRWQQRGCPLGSPEIDWLAAEEQIRIEGANSEKPIVSAVAETVGSVLGSVVGMVNSVTHLMNSDEKA